MKNSKKIQIQKIKVVTFLFLFFFACNTFVNNNVQANNKINYLSETFIVLSVNPTAELDKAKKDGKAVFLVITDNTEANIDKANVLAKGASAKVAKSIVISLNKDDKSNSSLVTKLGIANVPVPFILVISPKGMSIAGYQYNQVTTETLVKAVPSAKHEAVLFALSEKKPVFIVVSKKGLTDKTTILANCKSASAKVVSKPAIVEFDVNDSKDSEFLNQVGVTTLKDKTVTIVVNASGQIADKFEGIVLEAALTTSVNKVVKSSGCAPGACGSKKGCGK